MDKHTKIIDISSYYRKAYIVFVLTVLLAISIAVIFLGEDKFLIVVMFISAFGLSFVLEYIIKRDKVILDLGNILVSKHKEYFLSNGMKSIDKLRIRNELDYNEEQNRDAFVKFLERNELCKYDKIYLTGSHSSDDVEFVCAIVNNKD
jgi:hypothetical protein